MFVVGSEIGSWYGIEYRYFYLVLRYFLADIKVEGGNVVKRKEGLIRVREFWIIGLDYM